jgi:hypothetical protein
MDLNYSLNGIDPLWFPGPISISLKPPTAAVKVRITTVSGGNLPACRSIGQLLIQRRHSESEWAVTLRLTYRHSTTPLRTSPPPMEEWYETPGTLVYGEISIALAPEAVSQLRQVSAADHQFELTLEKVNLTDVSRRSGVENLR